MKTKDQFRGALLGLAIGDALGTTLEFSQPGTFEPITDMIGGGPFDLAAGQWTDDTSMALCLAESLIECKKFDPIDQLRRYCRWFREGHLSSIGHCFDIGNTTWTALTDFERTGVPSAPTDFYSAGNGSIMRLAAIPLFYANSVEKAIEMSGESSKTTHGATAAIDACRYFASLIVGAINGLDRSTLLSSDYLSDHWQKEPLVAEIEAIRRGSFKVKEPPEIRGSGYVVETLEAVLWAFDRSRNFREGALRVVNLGNDADTTGAVYGQIAGVFYGETGIPIEWRNKVAMKDLITNFADQIFEIKIG